MDLTFNDGYTDAFNRIKPRQPENNNYMFGYQDGSAWRDTEEEMNEHWEELI